MSKLRCVSPRLTAISFVKRSKSKTTAHAAALSVLLSPGLLVIDHIHFQYNGFLFGILILSLVLARDNSTLLLSGLLFAALLCFKHIYLYLAPAYFVYLLRVYCLRSISSLPYFTIRFFNCVKLGIGIIFVFGNAFGPFVLWGQLEQVFSRLFPFSRGLCHAYWAPNVWAIYSFTDRVLIYRKLCYNCCCDWSNFNSGPLLEARGQSRSSQQCHARFGWRLIVRCASGRASNCLFLLDPRSPDRKCPGPKFYLDC
jgi:hypothetical protein